MKLRFVETLPDTKKPANQWAMIVEELRENPGLWGEVWRGVYHRGSEVRRRLQDFDRTIEVTWRKEGKEVVVYAKAQSR